jgi:hypothetical protein
VARVTASAHHTRIKKGNNIDKKFLKAELLVHDILTEWKK